MKKKRYIRMSTKLNAVCKKKQLTNKTKNTLESKKRGTFNAKEPNAMETKKYLKNVYTFYPRFYAF